MLVHNIKLFSTICSISASLGSLIVTWDNNLRALVYNIKDSDDAVALTKKTQKLKRLTNFHTLAVLIVILQFLLGSNTSVFVKAQEVIAIGIMQCLNSHLHSCRIRAQDLIVYINGHFQFYDMYYHRRRKKGQVQITITEKLNKLFAQVFALTGLTFPTAVSAVHYMDPCRASLPGYWLLEECNPTKSTILNHTVLTIKSILARIAIFICSQWIWQFGVNASVFVNGGLMALATTGIKEHLEM